MCMGYKLAYLLFSEDNRLFRFVFFICFCHKPLQFMLRRDINSSCISYHSLQLGINLAKSGRFQLPEQIIYVGKHNGFISKEHLFEGHPFDRNIYMFLAVILNNIQRKSKITEWLFKSTHPCELPYIADIFKLLAGSVNENLKKKC